MKQRSLHLSSLETIGTEDPTNSTSALHPTRTKKIKRKFLRRKTQSESWSPQTAVPSTDVPNTIADNTPSDLQMESTYKPIHPSSAADTATPSSSTLQDIQRVISFIEDERHLVAHALYLDVKRRLDGWLLEKKISSSSEMTKESKIEDKKKGMWKNRWRQKDQHEEKVVDVEKNEEAYDFYLGRLKEFEALEKRATMFQTAQQNLNTPTSWTLSQTLFGITTHYRREADNTLSIKIEGELHGIPLFEQVVILRECDLYHTWAPFCTSSRKLAQLDKLDVVAWYNVGSSTLGLVRDACYRAVGCDCMREDGSVMIVAVGLGEENNLENDPIGDDDNQQQQEEQMHQPQTNESESTAPILNTNATSFLARDELLSTIELPPPPSGLGQGRMTIRNFSASIKILGASSARTRMVVNVDPNLHFLPQSLIDFCMKRMCGVLLARLQAAARKVLKDPVRNPHARRMREDVRFYRDWLLPKFRTYCEELGWVMPAVKAFEVTEDDLSGEEIFEGWRSEDMLDNCTANSINEVRNAIQNYQIAEKDNSKLDIGHRRTQSDRVMTNDPPRIRKRDRVKRFFQGSSLSGLEDDDCTPSDIYSESSNGRVRKRDKLKQLFAEKETREEKIAASREVAAARLRPEPFSESKALRLKELKEAKARKEDRMLRKNGGGASLSGSQLGSNIDFQTSSFRSESFMEANEFDEVGDLKRHTIILVMSLLLNVASIPLKGYAMKTLQLPPYLKMSSSDWAALLPRNLLATLMIVLHAISLWATLNTFLVIAFDTMDFGQKHLAKNLEYGKKLYVGAVKKYSKLVSIGIAVLSLCVGLISSIFHNIIFKMCSRLENGFAIPHISILEQIPAEYSWILDKLSHWVSLALDSATVVMGWTYTAAYTIRIPTVYKYSCITMSWIARKISSIIPSLLKRIGAAATTFTFQTIPNTIMKHLSICSHRTSLTVSWRSESFEVSSFITTRLAVFVLTLLFMSYLVLPKPEKKLRKKQATKDQRSIPVKVVSVKSPKDFSRSVPSSSGSTLNISRKHLSSSSGSLPMEVIDE